MFHLIVRQTTEAVIFFSPHYANIDTLLQQQTQTRKIIFQISIVGSVTEVLHIF